jgi:hypothetical protein
MQDEKFYGCLFQQFQSLSSEEKDENNRYANVQVYGRISRYVAVSWLTTQNDNSIHTMLSLSLK